MSADGDAASLNCERSFKKEKRRGVSTRTVAPSCLIPIFTKPECGYVGVCRSRSIPARQLDACNRSECGVLACGALLCAWQQHRCVTLYQSFFPKFSDSVRSDLLRVGKTGYQELAVFRFLIFRLIRSQATEKCVQVFLGKLGVMKLVFPSSFRCR